MKNLSELEINKIIEELELGVELGVNIDRLLEIIDNLSLEDTNKVFSNEKIKGKYKNSFDYIVNKTHREEKAKFFN